VAILQQFVASILVCDVYCCMRFKMIYSFMQHYLKKKTYLIIKNKIWQFKILPIP